MNLQTISFMLEQTQLCTACHISFIYRFLDLLRDKDLTVNPCASQFMLLTQVCGGLMNLVTPIRARYVCHEIRICYIRNLAGTVFVKAFLLPQRNATAEVNSYPYIIKVSISYSYI